MYFFFFWGFCRTTSLCLLESPEWCVSPLPHEHTKMNMNAWQYDLSLFPILVFANVGAQVCQTHQFNLFKIVFQNWPRHHSRSLQVSWDRWQTTAIMFLMHNYIYIWYSPATPPWWSWSGGSCVWRGCPTGICYPVAGRWAGPYIYIYCFSIHVSKVFKSNNVLFSALFLASFIMCIFGINVESCNSCNC